VTDSASPSLEELVALVASQAAVIEELRIEVAALGEENQRLRAENEQLKRRLSRNSGNSSMPSSTDDQPGKTAPKPRGKAGGGRSRGKQRGAPGSALAWSDHLDDVQPLVPEVCGGCGGGLEGAAGAGVVARQVIEIPLVTAERIEYRLHKKRCGCGHVTRAGLPPRGG
jgi:transposase